MSRSFRCFRHLTGHSSPDSADDPPALEPALLLPARYDPDSRCVAQTPQPQPILQRTAVLLEARQIHFAQLIAQEGGKR